MIPCHALVFETPKKVLLNGLWFGKKDARRVFVWLHGLTSSAWSRHALMEMLAQGDTAVLSFSNRGHDTVTTVQKGKKRVTAGGGAEVFTECVDDIDGAVAFSRSHGAKEVILVGHSTGCQKSVYWAFNRKSKGINGIVLLAPLSDWASANAMKNEKPLLKGATQKARALIKAGKPHAFLPNGAWHHPVTAQRFLSLFTPESTEQSIFPYFDERAPKMLAKVTVPVLALFAGKDEYSDRPAKKLEQWFSAHPPLGGMTVATVPRVEHSFKGGEEAVVGHTTAWLSRI